MKPLSLITGFLLLGSLALLTGWYILRSNILLITNIECSILNEKCSTQLTEQINKQLLGKPLFITDFSQVLSIPNVEVTQFSKHVPGKLYLQLETKQTQQGGGSFIQTSTVEDTVEFVTKYFADQEIEVTNVQVFQDENLVVATNGNRQILLSIKNLESDLTKTTLVLQNLDLDSIDLAIIEVDARYKLPVLRTSKSQF